MVTSAESLTNRKFDCPKPCCRLIKGVLGPEKSSSRRTQSDLLAREDFPEL